MSKGLEALKQIRPYANSSIDGCLDIVEKELKLLNIILDKDWFEYFVSREWFTKEEYDLLKEILL